MNFLFKSVNNDLENYFLFKSVNIHTFKWIISFKSVNKHLDNYFAN